MSASKDRLRWAELPARVKSDIQRLAGGPVLTRPDGAPDVTNCAGGFSPGLAALVRLEDRRMIFVKAMNAVQRPDQAEPYRAEARVAALLPPQVPAPRFLGSLDDGDWVILAFEGIKGREPAGPGGRPN